jgi:hypothetical protein
MRFRCASTPTPPFSLVNPAITQARRERRGQLWGRRLGRGREGPKNLAVDDYRPEKTRVFLLHEIVRANFIPSLQVLVPRRRHKLGFLGKRQSLQMNALQYPTLT